MTMPPSFAENFLQGYTRGESIKNQREQRQSEEEDRQLRAKLLKARLQMDETEAKLRERKAQQDESVQLFQLLSGSRGPTTNQELPLPTDPSQRLEAGTFDRISEGQHPEINIPSTSGGTLATVRPPNLADTLSKQRQVMQIKREGDLVDVPGLGKLDKSIADNLVTQLGAGKRQEQTQAFQAGETTKKQAFEAEQTKIKEAGANERAALAAASRMQAAKTRASLQTAMKDLPTAVSTKIEDLGSSLFQLGQIEDMKGVFAGLIGPVQGRIKTPLKQMIGKTSAEEETAMSTMQSYFNVLAKLRSGGAVTPQEEARLKSELQDKSLTPDQFAGRLQTQKDFLKTKLKLVLGGLQPQRQAMAMEQLSGVGISIDDAAPAGAGAGSPSWDDLKEARYQELLRKRAGGK